MLAAQSTLKITCSIAVAWLTRDQLVRAASAVDCWLLGLPLSSPPLLLARKGNDEGFRNGTNVWFYLLIETKGSASHYGLSLVWS